MGKGNHVTSDSEWEHGVRSDGNTSNEGECTECCSDEEEGETLVGRRGGRLRGRCSGRDSERGRGRGRSRGRGRGIGRSRGRGRGRGTGRRERGRGRDMVSLASVDSDRG